MKAGAVHSVHFTPLESAMDVGFRQTPGSRRRTEREEPESVLPTAQEDSKSVLAEVQGPFDALQLIMEAQREAKLIERNLRLSERDHYGAFMVARNANARLAKLLDKLIALEEM